MVQVVCSTFQVTFDNAQMQKKNKKNIDSAARKMPKFKTKTSNNKTLAKSTAARKHNRHTAINFGTQANEMNE